MHPCKPCVAAVGSASQGLGYVGWRRLQATPYTFDDHLFWEQPWNSWPLSTPIKIPERAMILLSEHHRTKQKKTNTEQGTRPRGRCVFTTQRLIIRFCRPSFFLEFAQKQLTSQSFDAAVWIDVSGGSTTGCVLRSNHHPRATPIWDDFYKIFFRFRCND